MPLIENITEHVRHALNDTRGAHDWEHTHRVTNLALHIASIEKADQVIVHLAALLHDSARHLEDQQQGRICHATEGAKAAKLLLTSFQVPPGQIDQVCHCIATHRFRGSAKPRSLEAKVLFDADKLDALGAVGIGRAFLFAGSIGAKLHNQAIVVESTEPYTVEDTAYREYRVKLRFIKDSMMTNEGRRLAIERDQYMALFFKRLEQEAFGRL